MAPGSLLAAFFYGDALVLTSLNAPFTSTFRDIIRYDSYQGPPPAQGLYFRVHVDHHRELAGDRLCSAHADAH